VAREITKIHEEFRSGALAELANVYADAPPKGEIVVIVHPPQRTAHEAADVDAFLRSALIEMSVKDAAEAAAFALNIPRKAAYGRALALKAKP
jgi:16S rRNA (cytidine1402-2'-O)-methyltransferase